MIPARHFTLAGWLATLPELASGHRLVGGAGHLLLDAMERRNVEKRLESDIFPLLFASALQVTIATGMAPGADLLFARTAQRWLTRAGIAHTLVAILPIPLDLLLDDWIRRLGEDLAPPNAIEQDRVGREVRALLEDCNAVVDLLPDPAVTEWIDDADARRQQYRKLAAVLAEQSDLLVAILRPGGPRRPGGTAEVVEWRQQPERIPVAFSTLQQRRPSSLGRLWVIDPSLPVERLQSLATAAGSNSAAQDAIRNAVRQARAALGSGNYLRCHDLVRQAQDRGLVSSELDYLSLLALANAGSTELALKRYRRLGARSVGDEDWLALEGRLLKDQAAAADPASAPALYHAAAKAYHAAFTKTGGRYPCLNAATTFLLAGETETATALAGELLAELADSASATDEVDHYYRHVTEAEAALLLGDVPRAHAALRHADAVLRNNVNVRSRSLAQLRLICRHQRIDPALLDALRLPPVVHLRDPAVMTDTPSAIAALVRDDAFVFVDLTDAAALAAIEALLDAGIRVHLVLAALPTVLRLRWIRSYDAATVGRLEAVLAAAHDLSIAHGFIDGEEAWCSDYVAAMARGLSQLMAQRLGCRWIDLHPAAAAPAMLGTTTVSAAPSASGFGRRCVGTLFADFVGFSRLTDDELPAFWTVFTGLVEQLTQRHADHILYHRTWGDALHVVATNAGATARFALDLRTELERLRPGLTGGNARLELRLAAHHAPVFVDNRNGSTTFFGSQLSFAARVEPVTPPGSVFVTEAFAAQLALEGIDQYRFEYAGEIDLPKDFGKYRLFGLRAPRYSH